MALSTALSGFTGKSSVSPKTRFGFVIGFNVVVVLTALAASSDFLQVFKSPRSQQIQPDLIIKVVLININSSLLSSGDLLHFLNAS